MMEVMLGPSSKERQKFTNESTGKGIPGIALNRNNYGKWEGEGGREEVKLHVACIAGR